jgi:3-carboxy-cis,cis-muconate cycloisomerase
MSIAALEHPHLAALLGDPEITGLLGADAEVRAMLAFEAALAEAQAAEGVIPVAAADAIATTTRSLPIDDGRLAAAAARDGLIAPELVRMLKAAVGPPHDASVHKGSTSQDVIDTALMVRLTPVVAVLRGRLSTLAARLGALKAEAGAREIMGRTRMQAALPIPLAHRLGQWRAGLLESEARLAELAPRLLVVQLGGAVGTGGADGPRADAIALRVAGSLGLRVPDDGPWQSNRARIVEFGALLGRIAGAAGKVGQDVVLMAQSEIGAATLLTGGGSSAMAHKRNPVKAEAVIALARHAGGLVGTLHQALIHEGERSGAAWTLEWLVLPDLLIAAGASLRLAGEILDETRF